MIPSGQNKFSTEKHFLNLNEIQCYKVIEFERWAMLPHV